MTMMKTTRATIAAVALLALPVASQAEGFNNSGNELKSTCENPDLAARCIGLIQGAWNGTDMTLAMVDKSMCVPPDVTLGQMKDLVLAYINKHPESRTDNSIVLTMSAVLEVWSCKTKPSEPAPANSSRKSI